jgi:hypothetical protein
MVTLGSSEVILKVAEVPGPRQSSAARPKRSVSPLLCWEWEWETDLPCRDKERQSSFSVHSGYIVDRVLVAGEVKGSFFPQCLAWLYLKQAPGGMVCCPASLEVREGSLRAAIKSWVFHWSQASSQLLNTLNAIFKRSPWGVWGPSPDCLSFLQISGKDWEIKRELRIIIPFLEDGSHAKSYHMLGLGI